MEQTFGRYRLLERLGEGGMAEVFKAKSFGVEGFEKVLVIKRILPKLAAQAKFVDMFVHEAKLAVRLSHANIVQVFDLGRVDPPGGAPTSFFIAMEYVPGLDLATLLARCRRQKIAIPFGMAVFLCAEVAKALDHAHRRRDEHARPLGIVHRDISPQNILLSWEGEVKVTDFGIAKAKDSIGAEEASDASTGRIRGKLAYMSPEQSRAHPLDGRSDLFSLGTVFYEMLTGNNPFVAPTAFETLRRLQAAEHPPLELLRPDAGNELSEIAARLLAHGPDDRFADAGRLHEHLLGYFYASGERFGPSKLAEFLERFREDLPATALETGGVFQEPPTGASERTPVEGPNPPIGTMRPMIAGLLAGASTGPFPGSSDRGERREVTALVISLIGARHDAPTGIDRSREEAAAGVEARANEVLARYGARVLEHDGSQVVALFGLGDADGRDTESAVRAALVILRGRGAAMISAGIHVAPIVVNAQGEPLNDERLASLTASAQALARATEGGAVLSAVAARIVRSTFDTQALSGAGPTTLSATGSEVAGSGALAAPEGARVVTSASIAAAAYGRFVGRHDELKRLGDILARATRRRVQLVTITGDKGIGKTRLLAEMERRLGKGNYNVGFYVAPCPRNGADRPWSALGSMLRVLCGIQEGDDDARIREVVPRLRALGLQAEESTAVLTELGAISAGGAVSPRDDASTAIRTAFARMVQSLCDDRLHCFCWDDAHAMDKATLEMILAVVARSARAEGGPPSSSTSSSSSSGGLRATFVLATRGDSPAALTSHPSHHQVTLGELSDDDAARLISHRAGARVLAPEIVAFCRERGGGHPLFLEELVKELADSGTLRVINGEAIAKFEGATAVPRTLRTLIAGRVSRLDAPERGVLQASAILGEPILTQVLAALLKQSVSQVDRAVATLVGGGFLRITGPAQVCFASPFHGEIVLDAIPPEARREIHMTAAAAFIAVGGGDGTDDAERVANHLYEAGDRDRAAGFFAQAAFHRMRSGHLEMAIRFFCRALDLAEHDLRAADELTLWLRALAGAVSRTRSATDLPSVTARALRRIDAAGTRAERVSGRVDVARALGAINLFAEAYERIEEAFTLAGDDDALHTRVLTVELESASRSGNFVRAIRAVEKLEAFGPLPTSSALLSASYARAASGNTAAALRAIDAAEVLDGRDDAAAAFEREKHRVLTYIYARDFKRAVEASARAVDLARSAGARFAIAAALHNLGDASRRLGDLPRAYAALEGSKEICDDAGHERLATLNRIHLAYIDGLRDAPGAEGQLRSFVRYADSRGYVTDALEGRFLLGALLRRRGALDEAKRELGQVLARAIEFGNGLIADDAREALAQAQG